MSESHRYIAAAMPSQPGKPYATSTSTVKIDVAWTASDANGSPITLYYVYQSENSGAYVLKGSSATNAFQATGLSMGSNFKFQVVAINAAGSGQISEESDFLIAATVPDKPTLLTRISADRTKITIGW